VYARVGAPAVTLTDGRVLVAGGTQDGSTCGSDRLVDAAWTADLWDPATDRFALAGAIPLPDRTALAATGIAVPGGRPDVVDPGRLFALPDGGALLLDRTEQWSNETSVTRSLRFDARTKRWTEAGVTGVQGQYWYDPRWGVRRHGAAAASLADGRVLVAGGEVVEPSGYPGGTRWGDLYDPATGRWLPLPPLPEALASSAALAFSDGTAIVMGGTMPDYDIGREGELVAVGFLPTGTHWADAAGAATTESGACPPAVLPSVLVALELQRRLECFAGRDLTFEANLVVAEGTWADPTYLDGLEVETPGMFAQVGQVAGPDDWQGTWPVFLTDPIPTLASSSNALPLRVADASVVPADLRARLHARVTAHVDDPSAAQCRPADPGWGRTPLSDEEAVLLCRGQFVVTRIEPLD
jgi:hypothetical protein